MRVCARACRRWCTGRCESAWSTGYHPRVKGRVSRKRKKRGRGRWAWFVFEVESTLHLLFPSFEGGAHRPSRITSSESIANSKEIPILSRHSRVAIRTGRSSSRLFVRSRFINSRELIGAWGRVWISGSLPESEGGIYGVCVVLEVLLVVIKLGAGVRLAGTKLYTSVPSLKRRHREERLLASMLSRN